MDEMNLSSKGISQKDKKLSNRYKSEVPNEIIEEQTKKIPNLAFLGGAFASMLLSAGLAARNRKVMSNFVGLWVPTILTLGLYNKIVKLEDEILRGQMH